MIMLLLMGYCRKKYDFGKRGITLARNVLNAINTAREVFEIERFPGNFFERLTQGNYADKCKLLLFKEDIDRLSGFIGYGIDGFAVICVNYKRPIGHQNFTLAHEVGHWFLHRGKSISDDDKDLRYTSDSIEKEANDFAGELLYPEDCLAKDFHYAIQQDLLMVKNRAQLGNYVDELCHEYCLSFETVLRRLLYKNRQAKQYSTVRKEIEKALGGKVGESFEKDFYVPNEELPQYQKLMNPYEDLQKKVDTLVQQGKIGKATGESIKMRNGVKIDECITW